MVTPGTLRIAVVGVGRIGSAFAFHLARNGHHDVTAIARSGSVRLAQLRRDSGVVDVTGERADVRVVDALDAQVAYDLIIVTLLAHQIEAVLPALKRSRAKCIQFMFNTFDPEQLIDDIGTDRCAFGMPFIQANIDEDGKLNATIGAGGQKSLMNQQRWVDVFAAAGLPAGLEPNMLFWLRCHAPLCVAFESISVAGLRRGGGATWGEAVVLARGLHESFILIRRLGRQVYPRVKSLLSISPIWVVASFLWSISRVAPFRELLATGEVECRALVDAMLAAVPQANPPVRAHLIAAMKPLERLQA